MDVTRIESLRESLRRMAEGSFADSPFYKCLALGMARDDGTLEILSVLPGEPLLGGRLFAAIQYLVLGGGGAELATVWPGIEATSMSTSPDIDKLAVLAGEFLLLHQAELADVMATRKISQTNEVSRGSYLVQAVSWLGDPAAWAVLVEVGASAGLLLNFDRYRYEFGERWFGDSASPVKVRVEQVGERSAPVSDIVRSPSVRVGLDIEPVDIFCDDDLRWLRACIWPDQPERVRRFLAAIDIARTHVPDVRRYDAITGLRTVCDDLSPGTPLFVFHASTLICESNPGIKRETAIPSTARVTIQLNSSFPPHGDNLWVTNLGRKDGPPLSPREPDAPYRHASRSVRTSHQRATPRSTRLQPTPV